MTPAALTLLVAHVRRGRGKAAKTCVSQDIEPTARRDALELTPVSRETLARLDRFVGAADRMAEAAPI